MAAVDPLPTLENYRSLSPRCIGGDERMKLLAIAIIVAGAIAAPPPATKPSALAVVHGWPILPTGRTLGMLAGVAVNSRNEVFVFDRGTHGWKAPLPVDPIKEPTISVFDGASGRLLREFGANLFAMPHGISIDRHDHLWVTDVGLNQVVELDPTGKVLQTLGTRGVAGSDDRHFDKPTDVAFTRDDGILVSDGYGNARVIEFDKDGRYRRQWGTAGKGRGQSHIPHAIAVDAGGRVLVADRENDRVELFDRSGRYLTEWKSPAIGRPFGLAALKDGRIAILDGGEQPDSGPDRAGLAIVDRAGRVLERAGRFGNYDGQFWGAHDVAAGPDGAIYVVDIAGQRVQKFVNR